jgi:hypothetical protein
MRYATRALLRFALPIAAAGAVAGSAAGCHPAPRERIAPGTAATLQVQNQGFADMTIYVLRDNVQRVRIGLSTGNTTQLFKIPADLIAGAGTLRFIADPVGGRRAPVSDEITVRPGDTVTLIIPPQ